MPTGWGQRVTGDHRGLDAPLHAQLDEEPRDGVLDGLLRDVQPLADLTVGENPTDHEEDLLLPVREAFGTSPRMRAISRVVAPGSSIDWPEATVRTAVTRSVPVICFRT
ncbi:hypothetical protein ADK53_17330 [Streptomyces sp. WM6373]|nr:hypothetical protein ADK53_17330 [Streptomyces sp. WM6373]